MKLEDFVQKISSEIEEKITKGEMKETVTELVEDDAYKAAKAKFETATEKATKEVETELSRKAGLDENILRHLIVRLDEE